MVVSEKHVMQNAWLWCFLREDLIVVGQKTLIVFTALTHVHMVVDCTLPAQLQLSTELNVWH